MSRWFTQERFRAGYGRGGLGRAMSSMGGAPGSPPPLVGGPIGKSLRAADRSPIAAHDKAGRVQGGEPPSVARELSQPGLDRSCLRVRLEGRHDGGEEARVQLGVL